MGDVSEHFSRKEFACKDGCGFNAVDIELVTCLEGFRDYIQAAVIVLSGCRCVAHNTAVGGSPKSQHMFGKGADIRVSGIHPQEIYDYFDRHYPDKYGIGLYVDRIHFDVRPLKARWNNSGD
jgi:uncharacterized protein YcbK (DUF882 family)